MGKQLKHKMVCDCLIGILKVFDFPTMHCNLSSRKLNGKALAMILIESMLY